MVKKSPYLIKEYNFFCGNIVEVAKTKKESDNVFCNNYIKRRIKKRFLMLCKLYCFQI